MSERRGSISDYPEHLNPFYEGNEKLRFWKFGKPKRTGSFRDTLRNTLTFKSFRGKKKDKQEAPSSPPELRNHSSTVVPPHRQTLPTTLSPIYSPARNSTTLLLPRSRFSERVARSSENPGEEAPAGSIPATIHENASVANPFDDDDKCRPKRIRRKKRRAPLPPNMVREEGDDLYLGVSSRHSFSKWSLTSVETDISTYSESDNLALDVATQEMCEIMHSITKEMEKMTDETDPDESKDGLEEKPHSDIPDIIASSTEGAKKEEPNKLTESVIEVVVDASEDEHSVNPIDENSNVIKCETLEEESKKCDNLDQNSARDQSECDKETNLAPQDSNNDIIHKTTYDHAKSMNDLNFNERKSVYISGSTDQLVTSLENIDNLEVAKENTDINQNKSLSPPLSPRCKTEIKVILDTSIHCLEKGENADETDERSDQDMETTDYPIPKIRTQKPTKHSLLGNQVIVSD